MTPTLNQRDMATEVLKVIASNRVAYLAAEERTGKTLASLMVARNITAVSKVLVITTVKASVDWLKTVQVYPINKLVSVITYTKPDKFIEYKDYDMIILDESHKYISSYPKPSATYKALAEITKSKILLYLSATPSSQGYPQLFHQLHLSSWSPTRKYTNFYRWFEVHGIPECIRVGSRFINKYDSVRPSAYEELAHLFVKRTRTQAGLTKEPSDVLHYVELAPNTLAIYKGVENNIFRYGDNIHAIETSMERITKLHMLESGTTKLGDDYIVLENTEKIDYILNMFGDSRDLVIFYNYKAELLKLRKYFTKAFLAQATSYAEGVDFSGYRHLVILSMDFSTARYSQRRNRQSNINRVEDINVHYILCKGSISEQVYETVAINKQNFIDTYYRGLS